MQSAVGYDHTRSELLSQVDAAWELSVPVDQSNPAAGQGDEYVIDGTKRFISHGSVADLLIVFAVMAGLRLIERRSGEQRRAA